MAHFIFNYAEWEQICIDKGFVIVKCTCADEDCLVKEKICRVYEAIDQDGIVQSAFKKYMNYGVIYD